MSDRVAVSDVVLGVMREVCPSALTHEPPPEDTRLGEGLGLDSIEVIEVVMGCEDHFGIPVADLIETGPLTFGRVVDHFTRR